jgi:hypothetical protein
VRVCTDPAELRPFSEVEQISIIVLYGIVSAHAVKRKYGQASGLASLPAEDNDFQQEQAAAAREAARQLDLAVHLVHADNDAIEQSDQILKAVQAANGERPDAKLFGPLLPRCRRRSKLKLARFAPKG